ncbi:MAG: 6-phosphofructokinase [Bacteroidetes bacterium]|nr:6-phosphofructokinase [Bacteroidota bacterium]
MGKISRIAVFTSGGDAPGMNAAVRAVVRTALFHDLKVFGIYHGYDGMIRGEIRQLHSSDVSNIIQCGGTILKSARSEEFRTKEGRKKAYEELLKHDIEAVVAIGGDGTFRGAGAFTEEFNIPFVGLPGTIDNDLYGTDFTIGFDTAVNTVMEAVDKLRDTAASHERVFFVEVMGRDAGFIALRSGIAVGAEAICIPEFETHLDELKAFLRKRNRRIKTSSIVLVAEGDDAGGAIEVSEKIKEDTEFAKLDIRVTILGHIQRGGSPSAADRFLASRLGIAAVEALLDDQKSIMVGMVNNEIVHVPFNKTIKHHRTINEDLLDAVGILSLTK